MNLVGDDACDRLCCCFCAEFGFHLASGGVSPWSVGLWGDQASGIAQETMACPMAFHAAKKVRENMNKPVIAVAESQSNENEWNAKFKFYEAQGGVLARRYNEKMMNAIWGLYNRNSAHNFKSRVDGGEPAPASSASASVMSFDSVAYQISRLTPGLLNHHP